MERAQIRSFIVGVIAGSFLISGSAFAINSYRADNTAEGGYLLCANTKSRAVSFPAKLNCPNGSIALDLGAFQGTVGPQGSDGPEGPAGPQGPSGLAGGQVYRGVSAKNLSMLSSSKYHHNLFTIDNSQLPLGLYRLTAEVIGIWSTSAKLGSQALCFFTTPEATDFPMLTPQFGRVEVTRQTLEEFQLNVRGDWDSEHWKYMELHCKTSGDVNNIKVQVTAEPISIAGTLPNTN